MQEDAKDIELIEINRLDEIPEFKNEDEEAEFWGSHSLGNELLAEMEPVPEEGDDELPPARTPPCHVEIAIKWESDQLDRIKRLAAKKHVTYQAHIKRWAAERLYEEEKLEGVIR